MEGSLYLESPVIPLRGSMQVVLRNCDGRRRFTCDWDPPAGHDWAGYPIRADAGLQGSTDKTLDPKKQYRWDAYPTLFHS